MNELKIKEEIIIDGVNVKDCKRRIGKNNYCRYYKRPCAENNYNCIWKKYYRKERECEELKNKIEFMEEYIKTVENARDEFERESKFLKEENTETRKFQYEQDFLQQQLDKVIKENKEIKTCYKNNLALLDKEEVNTTKLVNKVMKLEKFISEIKEIAEGYEDTHNQECKQLCCTEILEKLKEL